MWKWKWERGLWESGMEEFFEVLAGFCGVCLFCVFVWDGLILWGFVCLMVLLIWLIG